MLQRGGGATDQGMTLTLCHRFLTHMGVDAAIVRLVVQKLQHIDKRQLSGRGMQPFMNGADESQIVDGIHAQSNVVVRQRRIFRQNNGFDRLRMQLQITGDMLARDRLVRGIQDHPE